MSFYKFFIIIIGLFYVNTSFFIFNGVNCFVYFRRKVSHGLLPAETSITKKDFTHTLTTKSVTISPGTNRFTLEMMVCLITPENKYHNYLLFFYYRRIRRVFSH